MEKEIIEKDKLIILYCWHCGKKFFGGYGKFDNVYAGQIFCSEKCRKDNILEYLRRGDE